MKNRLSAPQLRIVLILALIVAIGAGVGGFIFLRGLLVSKADEIATITTEVRGLSDSINRLENADKLLKANNDVEQKALEMVSKNQSYLYQDRIVGDMKLIAEAARVSIKSVEFNDVATDTKPAAGTGASALQPAANMPSDIKQATATITINSPVDYNNLLVFIRSIEQNNLKMQVAKVTLTGVSDNKNSVTSDAFIIGVYIRP